MTSMAYAMLLAQVLPHPQLIFLPKPGFLEFIWVFNGRYLPHSKSKSYQINSIKSWSSRSFHKMKGTFQFLWNFQLQFNLIFNGEIIQYSRTFAPQVQTSWNQAHAPLLVESFPKTQRTWSEASQFDGSHNYKIKQNKLPSFINMYSLWKH
jgi:hypothetical protein